MTVSIIIGNYNYARFLGQAIDSALGQTHPDTEVIVVDDGSTDDSRDVIARYGKRVVAILKSNAGMASTYNAAVPRSRGDVVIFLDADDMLVPTAVERILQCFTTTAVAKTHWPLMEIDAAGNGVGAVVPSGRLGEGDFRKEVMRLGPDAYLSPPTSGNAWARAFLDAVLPVPEAEFRQHADVYLTTLAGVFGRVAAIAAPLGYYRVHGANDYAHKPADEKLRRNLAIYERRCRALSAYLQRAEGVHIDPATWMDAGSPYAWMTRLHAAMNDVKSIVPPGSLFILADEQQWGERRARGEILTDRRSIPFTERDGMYYGPPADDESAIRELERLRGMGAEFFVLGWPAFWWQEHYPRFRGHLNDRYPVCFSSNDAVIFDLRRS